MTKLHPAIERMKSGPILSTLLRLAVPNVLAMVMTVLVGITETFYIGRLGTTPLAAIALVFPFAMLTQMMSSGAMGGAVSSAISRALGANQTERANTLAVHAITIGSCAGIIYTLIFLLFGAHFYHFLGGRDAVLAEAVGYSNVLFWGAFLLWLSNTLASILRGTGNMVIPSVAIFATAILQIILGGVLGLGAGPVPSFGMIGVAYGFIIATAVGVLYFLWYLTTGRGRIRLSFRGVVLQKEMFYDILKVGALACLSPVQSVFAILIFTGLIARLGVLPLAGYGIGQRLEFLLIPISFGIGVAAVPMVGMAIGAGNIIRARKVAWTAGLVSAVNLALVGGLVTIAPDLWASLFTTDESVLNYARQYLRTVGPAFPFFGLGLTLYFASQGSGKVLGPVLAGTLRLALVAGVGAWLAMREVDASDYFLLMATVMFIYGVSTAAVIKVTRWGTTKA
ncbi:MAG: MATE family efflux transporter [Sheuella sp.]|nr:MATE family efflux transporter [Sheuella sp.]